MPEAPNPVPYDLLLQKGHVIDPKNGLDRVTDVAIKDGVIAKVGDDLNLTPGLIDMHMHMYATTGEKNSYAGDKDTS